MDFIEMYELHSTTGRLNWTERKPKMMKYKKKNVFNWTFLTLTFYYTLQYSVF